MAWHSVYGSIPYGNRIMTREFLLTILLGATIQSNAAEVVLYDGSLGTLPSAQSWLGLGSGSFPAPIHNGQGASVDTTGDADAQFGYFTEDPIFGGSQHPLMPTLSRHDGFEVSFSLQILAENHAPRDDNGDGKLDRAGYSVIVISEDLSGLELGFFENKVWAYEDGQTNPGDLFTQAENALFDTTEMIDYRLSGDTGGYSLFANDVNILNGDWRQYSASSFFPYDNPSSLFFGDDTTSASSSVLLTDISVQVGPFPEPTPVPIPPAAAMLLAGSIILRAASRR
ncbi:MAG: choice-of-anchor Y domain-containing protein [Gammaproteobacteria bacterium]